MRTYDTLRIVELPILSTKNINLRKYQCTFAKDVTLKDFKTYFQKRIITYATRIMKKEIPS